MARKFIDLAKKIHLLALFTLLLDTHAEAQRNRLRRVRKTRQSESA
jgi:hypothetical protein